MAYVGAPSLLKATDAGASATISTKSRLSRKLLPCVQSRLFLVLIGAGDCVLTR